MSRREPYKFKSQPSADGAKVFWKSLEEKANPAEAQLRAESEFPLGLAEAKAGNGLIKLRKNKQAAGEATVGRRGFMFFTGAAAALFAEGCARRPVEKILPYSKAPEHVLPGRPTYYASVFPHRGDALGVLVESHEGRPTKVEGNPAHPSSLGATDHWAQASIYDMYDPDRGTVPLKGVRQPQGGFANHAPVEWSEVETALADLLRVAQTDGGARLRILAEPTSSPTFVRLREQLKRKLPQAKVHTWSAVNAGNAHEGARLAFGRVVNVVPSFEQAKVIVALDSDFLETEPGNVRANRGFAAGRKLEKGPVSDMNRLYVVEPAFTTTGMNADHRLRLPAQDIERYLMALAHELATAHDVDLGAVAASVANADPAGIPEKWIKVVASDLAASRAKSVITVGSRQPARVHALAHAVNAALGNLGHSVRCYPVADPLEESPAESLKQLAQDIEKGSVTTLIILGGNPVYDAPGDIDFLERLRSVANTVHLSLHVNETSSVCGWYIPRAHELEAWCDHRSLDGTLGIQQPLIAPLFHGWSDIEMLARVAGVASPKGHALVQETVRSSVASATSFTRAWNEGLKSGLLGATGRALGALDVRVTEVGAALAGAKPAPALSPQSLEVTFAPCPKLYDGRHANNPLLLELPDPVSKVTWDNVAFVSPGTARALGVESGTTVRLSREGAKSIETAMWVMPGQADNSIALFLGWGRQKVGRYGDRRGFDVNPLRSTDAMGFASGVTLHVLSAGELDALRPRLRNEGLAGADLPLPARVRPDDPFEAATNKYKISQTQEHGSMEGRPIAIDATLEQYRKNPHFVMFPDEERRDRDEGGNEIPVRRGGSPDPSIPPLWGEWKEEEYFKDVPRWAMGIDLSTCTGCNACVVACQVENNVPVVGKEEVWRGREMYWLRVDRYFVGLDENDPEVVFQPVACVQCEEAPCENVCPVNATAHSPEGLNDMAYNRCIGTRYCANNCPYKVRRFNFLNYHSDGGMYMDVPDLEKMRFNPNVTVRMRGVMEKCTYCVQRIQEAKIKSKRTGKPLKDGDVVTACAQACPADAIIFGDLSDPNSRVSNWRARDRAYRLLADIGTRPRTTYLGKIRNPNPMMEKAG